MNLVLISFVTFPGLEKWSSSCRSMLECFKLRSVTSGKAHLPSAREQLIKRGLFYWLEGECWDEIYGFMTPEENGERTPWIAKSFPLNSLFKKEGRKETSVFMTTDEYQVLLSLGHQVCKALVALFWSTLPLTFTQYISVFRKAVKARFARGSCNCLCFFPLDPFLSL